MSKNLESVNIISAYPGSDILRDPGLLSGSGASSAIPLLDGKMDSQPKSRMTGNGASDQSPEFREKLTQHWDHEQQTDFCSSASSDEMTVIFCRPSKNIQVLPTASATATSVRGPAR